MPKRIAMTEDYKMQLQAIRENLEHGDLKKIAIDLRVEHNTVIQVANGYTKSQRIFNALLETAMRNKQQLINISSYLSKPINLTA